MSIEFETCRGAAAARLSFVRTSALPFDASAFHKSRCPARRPPLPRQLLCRPSCCGWIPYAPSAPD